MCPMVKNADYMAPRELGKISIFEKKALPKRENIACGRQRYQPPLEVENVWIGWV